MIIPLYLLCFLRKEYRGSRLLVVVLVYRILATTVFPVQWCKMTSYVATVPGGTVIPSCRDQSSCACWALSALLNVHALKRHSSVDDTALCGFLVYEYAPQLVNRSIIEFEHFGWTEDAYTSINDCFYATTLADLLGIGVRITNIIRCSEIIPNGRSTGTCPVGSFVIWRNLLAMTAFYEVGIHTTRPCRLRWKRDVREWRCSSVS